MSTGFNSRDIAELHPAVQRGCRELIRRMGDAGFNHVGVSGTYRDHAHQDWLFAQGRTRPGNIITNAQGGQSWHNWRLAFDIFQNIRGQEWNNQGFFVTAGQIWTAMGGEWGGSWANFPDRPHMQYTGGLTLRGMVAGQRLPYTELMPWEEKMLTEAETRATQTDNEPHQAVAGWATAGQAWAMENELFDGTRPTDPLTRQEAWTVLHRYHELTHGQNPD